MTEQITDLYGAVDQEAMYQAAIAQPLERKIEQDIALLQAYEGQALQLSPDGYYGCQSGGKDSAVVEELLKMAGVKFTSNYSNVTIDPPELVWHLKKHYPNTVWHSVGTALPLYMGKHPKGPPTRVGRWCCEIYKEHGGDGKLKVVGVRAEESKRRKGLWTQVKKDTRNGGIILAPLVYWTDKDVWEFIRKRNIPYCSLYDEGFERLGCVGCPLAGPAQQKKEFDRWPGHMKLWQRGFQAHMEKWKGVPRRDGENRWIERFDTWQQMWDWWLSGKAYEEEGADCQLYLW